MKPHPLLCFLLLAALNTGCSFFVFARRNIVESPLKALDYCVERHRFLAWAEEAWKEIEAHEPGPKHPRDYVCGFIDGYVDFLDREGNGEPPAAPPDRYQCSHYETPEGRAAILEW